MANEFLTRKWRHMFHAYDINKDNEITIEDADLFSGNFSRYHKFDGERAESVKADARTYWRDWVLKGLKSADEETFMANMEKAYLADKDKFREDARRLFSLIMNFADVNGDSLLSEDEFMVMVKSTGFKDYDDRYMKSYPQVKPGFISLDVYLDVFVEFNCNDDITKIEREKPRHYGMGILDFVEGK